MFQAQSSSVQRGTLLWLPHQEQVRATMNLRHSTGFPICTPSGEALKSYDMPYGHPVIVVDRPAHDTTRISFVVCTSFGRTGLKRRYPDGRYWSTYFSIGSGEPHPLVTSNPDIYKPLSCQDGVKIDRPGYVSVSTVYKMDWRDAEPWTGHNGGCTKTCRLDVESLSRLLPAVSKATGWEPGAQRICSPRRYSSVAGQTSGEACSQQYTQTLDDYHSERLCAQGDGEVFVEAQEGYLLQYMQILGLYNSGWLYAPVGQEIMDGVAMCGEISYDYYGLTRPP